MEGDGGREGEGRLGGDRGGEEGEKVEEEMDAEKREEKEWDAEERDEEEEGNVIPRFNINLVNCFINYLYYYIFRWTRIRVKKQVSLLGHKVS